MLALEPVILDSSIEYIYSFVSVQTTLNVFNINGHRYSAESPIYKFKLWKEHGDTDTGVYELVPHRLSGSRLLNKRSIVLYNL